jgi:hypothetical protein
LLGLFFSPGDGWNMFLQNVGRLSKDYRAFQKTELIKNCFNRLPKYLIY